MSKVAFTGEYVVPGETPRRIEDDHRARYEFATRYVGGARVLDAACGTGYGARMLRDAGATCVTGVDIGETQVAYAEATFAGDGVDFIVGDVVSCGNAGTFDVVVSFETIEHVQDYEAVLANFSRVLKPGGIAVISSPNRVVTSPRARTLEGRPSNQFHVREFVAGELAEALGRSGLQPVGLFVQRERLRLPRALRIVMNRLRNPDERSTSEVRAPRRFREGRYFVVVACKGPGGIDKRNAPL